MTALRSFRVKVFAEPILSASLVWRRLQALIFDLRFNRVDQGLIGINAVSP